MNRLIAILGIVAALTLPSGARAQSIIDGSDASRLGALIRAKLCEKTCRYGRLSAERYNDTQIELANRYKLYVIGTRACDSRGCQQAMVAINNGSMIKLAEGFDINPNSVQIPTEVGARKGRAGPRNGVACAAPGRQLNTALLKQTFAGKTLNGFTDKGTRWTETLQSNGRTRFVNSKGKVTVGRYLIASNNVCFKYRAGQDFNCKAIYECNSNEGEFVIANQARKLTSVITHVSAGAAAAPAPAPAPEPVPTPQATFDPLKPLVPGGGSDDLRAALTDCSAVRSDLARLQCYDKLANPARASRFRRAERARLTELMNFRNLSGVTLTKAQLNQCTLTISVDAPEVRLSFANEAVINMAHLDLGKSRSFVRGQDALFSFVAQSRRDWPLRTIDKARGSERSSRNAEALLAVTADPANLPEVEKLLRVWAEQCQA